MIWRRAKKGSRSLVELPHPPPYVPLPPERDARTFKIYIPAPEGKDPIDGYLIVGFYEDGRIAEMFWRTTQHGELVRGLLDALCISVSIGLKRGIPFREYAEHLARITFPPNGFCGDKHVPNTSSIIDLIFRKLMLRFGHNQPGYRGPDRWR